MRHFPIYLDLDSQTVVISGAGETAVAKLRLLLKTDAKIFVYGTNPDRLIQSWARAGKLSLIERQIRHTDIKPAKLFYCANDDETEDLRALALAHKIGVLTNVVDDLQNSDFITPAMVDRAPLTIAIGTEGAAPVLARQIKKTTGRHTANGTRPHHADSPKFPQNRGKPAPWSQTPRLLVAVLFGRGGGGLSRGRGAGGFGGIAPFIPANYGGYTRHARGDLDYGNGQ